MTAARALDAALLPDERVVWSDRARARPLRALGLPPRSPAELGRVAALALLGAAGASWGIARGGPEVAALVVMVAGCVALSIAVTVARSARYAITDRGRGLIAAAGEVIAFDLPGEVLLRADPDLETGDLDLGERAVVAHPGGRTERRSVVLRAVSYPTVVRDLVLQAARGAVHRAGQRSPDAG